MKREGRQHGMVRTYRILPDPLNQTTTLRFVKRIEAPPTAGLFTKVSTKPTNHSKSTGLTSTNSKAKKSKRMNNNKYNAVLIDGVHFTGASASSVLSRFYQHQVEDAYDVDDQRCGYAEYGSRGGGVYEIEENDLTDQNYCEEDEVEENDQPLTTTMTVEQTDPGVVEDRCEFKEAGAEISEEEEDEIVVDEDGGSVTIGEVVVLLEQVAVDDEWCFIGDNDQF